MKAYTDLKQSKKLANILPIESADMMYDGSGQLSVGCTSFIFNHLRDRTPCWSLAALINVLPKDVEIESQRYAPCLFPVQDKWLLRLWYNANYTITSPIAIFCDNPVDACYEMILKLKERSLI